jgi:hypothetical protein
MFIALRRELHRTGQNPTGNGFAAIPVGNCNHHDKQEE